MKVRRQKLSALFRPTGCALLATSWLLSASTADARKRGFNTGGCEGCHGATVDSSLSAGPLVANPGETISFQIVLSDSEALVGGLFVETDDLAGVSIPSGQSIVLVNSGVTHTGPVPFSNGSVTFSLSYQVPATPGATQFSVWAVAANGNDDASGDEVNQQTFALVYGCEPQTYYADLDNDGHGRDAPTRISCAGTPPPGFAAAPDDCDDNDATENPSAPEICNGIDDNCNGEVDEGAAPMELFPDADGDGYYSYAEWQSGDSVIGCVPYPGYAAKPGDCEPNAAHAHPGGIEVCDLRLDEDCDGSVDERVKPFCGVGGCSRESYGCTLEDCTPGQPSEEVCNFVDDDCDGEVDEGDLCPPGQECLAGLCRDAASLVPQNPSESSSSGGNTSEGGSSNSGSSPDLGASTKGAPAGSSCAVVAPGALAPGRLWLGWIACVITAGLIGRFRSRRRSQQISSPSSES